MGAHSLTQYIQTDKSFTDIWNDIYSDARSTYGDDAYSGSFATCRSITRIATPMGLSDAKAVANAMFSNSLIPASLRGNMLPMAATLSGQVLTLPQKWGSAFAIPVYAADESLTKSETVSIKHDLQGHLSDEKLLPLLKENVPLPTGAWFDNIKVVSDTVKYKKKVEKAVGKFSNQWVLLDSSARRLLKDTRFASEREAIAAAVSACEEQASNWYTADQGIHVASIRYKGDKPTKVSVEQTSRKTTISFDVCTCSNGKAGGWFIFALVAS